MASLEYDPTCNALYIRLRRSKIAETEPVADNVMVDLNRRGQIVGIEVLGPAPISVERFREPVRIVRQRKR